LRTRQLASCPGAPSVIYVTLQQKGGEEKWSAGVYRSDDGGETWQARNNGFRQISGKPGFNNMCSTWTDKIVVHPDNPDIVYVGGAAWWETGIYKTVDGGLNWSRILTKSKEGWIDFWGQVVTCLSLSPASPNALAFGTSGMVFRSDDGGSSWHSRYSEVLEDGRIKGTGLEVTCLHSITPDKTRKGRFFLGYYDIGLLITDDNGKTFRRSMNGIPKKFINSCFSIVQAPDNPLCLWGGFGSWGGTGSGIVAKSIDGGKSWTPCTKDGNGWVNSQPRNIVSFGGNGVYRIVYTSRKGLISSDNGGESWAINTNLVFGAMTRDGDTLYAAKNGGNKTSTLWKSVDEGRTWSIMPATTALKVGEIKAIAVKDNQILFSARRNRIGSDSGGAWYSSDGGVTFTKVVEDYFCQGVLITQDAILVSMIDHPYHNFPGGGGIRISRDKGKTWKSLNTPTLQNRNISSLVLDPFTPNSIWAGSGGNSIFITTLLPVQ
jgi:photosystem II stability/assembly factor-like uncharacterized protein